MNIINTAWAQEGGAPSQGGSVLGMFMPLVIVFVIFYLLIFRPQRKQQKVRKEMLAGLKRGDEVITNGGIYGKISDIQDAFVMLQVANNVTIKLDRSQVNNQQALAAEKK